MLFADKLTECSNRTETDQHQMCFSLELPDGSLAYTNRNVRQILDGAEVCDTNKTCSIASYSCLRPASENLTQIRCGHHQPTFLFCLICNNLLTFFGKTNCCAYKKCVDDLI